MNSGLATLTLRAGQGAPEPARLRVLTLTPFYPSLENPVEGCFIAEPLLHTAQFAIDNEVIAVSPAYRSSRRACRSEISSSWHRFVAIPGNLGLPSSGAFLAKSLLPAVSRMHHASRIDVIHAHAALPCGYGAMALSQKLNIPFVVSVHGLDVFSQEQAGALLGRWTRPVSLKVYRNAAKIICISGKVRDSLPAELHEKAVIVYNGVDVRAFSVAPQPIPSRLCILSVGNLIPIKDHALLLHAFSDIASHFPNCDIEIIGDGPERQNLVGLSQELGLAERVRFLGRQSREQVAAAMRRCSIFVLPSRYEGLGCVYLEAMACAKPVIACAGQGISEIVGHGINGMLIHPGDRRELSQALGMLLENPALRTRIGLAARNTITHGHTLEHQAQQLATIYRECVA